MRTLIALIQISFYNIIRQSFYSLVLVGAYLFILSSPSFTMFTFFNAKKLILDMGMATILISILGISVLSIFSVIGGEMEEKTATLLLSKPISKITFLFSKIIAVFFANFFVVLPLTIILIMTIKMGVPEAVWSKVEYYILWFAFLPLILGVVSSASSNYYADKNFASSFVISLNIFIFLSFLLLYFMEKDLMVGLFRFTFLLWLCGLILTSIVSLFSLKGNIFFALIFGFIVFLIGLTSEYFLSRIKLPQIIKVFSSIFPNFQIFWNENFWHKGTISFTYLLKVLQYSILYTAGVIFLGWSLWETREISGGR